MTKDVLIKYAPIGVAILRANVSKVNATGKTVASIRFVIDTLNNRLQILGRGYFQALETGRAPRSASTYGHFDDSMEEWMQAKGFPQRTSKSGVKYFNIGGQWYSAKSMAWKINKTGDKMWRQGHGAKVRDVYSLAMADFLEELKAAIVEDKKQSFKKTVLDSLKAA